jgi:hypothetical protein
MINFVSDCRIGLCKVFYKSETTHSQINSTIVMDDIPMSFSRHLTSSVFFFFFFLGNFFGDHKGYQYYEIECQVGAPSRNQLVIISSPT